MPTQSLLFIPDITGLTEFVNHTELDHSQHIFSELLEIIIDNNQLGLEVSKIEGDAVLFYKVSEVPNLKLVYEQAKTLFMKFHEHLKLYDSQRICQCGACSTASKLSLKFIVHCAEIGFTIIKNVKKPFGADLVLLHKLFKNEVKYGECILFTDQYLEGKKREIENFSEGVFEEGDNEYDNIGTVSYKYISLSKLLEIVPNPPPVILPAKMKDPVVAEHIFDIPLMESNEYVSNFDLQKTWNKDMDKFIYEKGKINRIGTRHICVFEKSQAEFESVTNDFGSDKIVYGEKFLMFPLAKDFIFYCILSPLDNKTKGRIEVHYQPVPIIGWLLKPMIKMNIKKINLNFIKSFSKLERPKNIEFSTVVN